MLDFVRRRLSIKVSIVLALLTIPPTIIAAYLITSSQSGQLVEMTLANGKAAAMTGAKMYGQILDESVDAGWFTVKDLVEPVYEDIKGFSWGDNPRFHTKYDMYLDRTVKAFQDKMIESSPDLLYVLGMDTNGYSPSPNSKYEQPITGDVAKDLNGNRAKRKFTAPIHVTESHNLEPVLVLPYLRDTGDEIWDVSSPIFVKDRHWGSFRVGVSRQSIAIHRRTLLLQLSAVFGFLAIVTVGFIFLMLRRAIRPLELLTEAANKISTGEDLDAPIKQASIDEIGQMAKSLLRLRASLQVAMNRLNE